MQQQAAEGDQVRVEHPREAALREAEVTLDRRQGHVDDRRVEHIDEDSRAKHVQSKPAAAAELIPIIRVA